MAFAGTRLLQREAFAVQLEFQYFCKCSVYQKGKLQRLAQWRFLHLPTPYMWRIFQGGTVECKIRNKGVSF